MGRTTFYLLTLSGLVLLVTAGCAINGDVQEDAAKDDENAEEQIYDQNRVFGQADETRAELTGQIAIEGLGRFDFVPNDVQTHPVHSPVQ